MLTLYTQMSFSLCYFFKAYACTEQCETQHMKHKALPSPTCVLCYIVPVSAPHHRKHKCHQCRRRRARKGPGTLPALRSISLSLLLLGDQSRLSAGQLQVCKYAILALSAASAGSPGTNAIWSRPMIESMQRHHRRAVATWPCSDPIEALAMFHRTPKVEVEQCAIQYGVCTTFAGARIGLCGGNRASLSCHCPHGNLHWHACSSKATMLFAGHHCSESRTRMSRSGADVIRSVDRRTEEHTRRRFLLVTCLGMMYG